MKLNKVMLVVIVLGIIAVITVVYQLTKENMVRNISINQPIIYLSSVDIVGGFYKGYQGEAIEMNGTSYYVCIRLENGFLYSWIDRKDLKIKES